VAGQTLPCPACGTPFVVQPVARAPDDFLPPSVDLAAGAPIVPASRVLEPVVYPHYDIPWALIAIGTGLCLVLGLIVFGGWQAYRAIDAVIANSPSTQGELASSVASDLGAGAVADTADQVAADAAAVVSKAGKAIDQVAEAVTSSVKVPKLLPDTHARCASERAKLRAEINGLADSIRAGTLTVDQIPRLADLTQRLGDLTIRWHLLPPMTEAERESLAGQVTPAALNIDPDTGKANIEGAKLDPTVGFLILHIGLTDMALAKVVEAQANGSPRPANELEQRNLDACQAIREASRHLFAVRAPADLERSLPLVEMEFARLAEMAGSLSALEGLSQDDFAQGLKIYGPMLAHEQMMYSFVESHVITRYAIQEVGLPPASIATSSSDVAERYNRFRISLGQTSLQLTSKKLEFHNAVSKARARLAPAALASTGAPSSDATSTLPDGGPVVAIPPGLSGPSGFGIPPGFGPSGFGPSGFGPPTGLGGPGPFGPHPRPSDFSDANIDADFEAKRQKFAQDNGADRILTIRASGGSEGQFRALELTVMRLIRPNSHSMSRVGSRFQLSVAYAGDVERIAAAIQTGRVVNTDVSGRLIVVEIK